MLLLPYWRHPHLQALRLGFLLSHSPLGTLMKGCTDRETLRQGKQTLLGPPSNILIGLRFLL